MAEFHFFSTWDLEAPIQPVWDVISNPLQYSTWWKYLAKVTELEASPPGGCGGLYRYHWKTALPYTLSFDMRHTRYEPPHLTAGTAHGELEGVGTWEVQEKESYTRVTYDWQVRTTKSWMDLFAPVARLAFVWNHGKVMTAGAEAISARLGVRLLSSQNVLL